MWAGVAGRAYHEVIRQAELSFREHGLPEGGADWDIVATVFADTFAKHFAEAIAEECLKYPVPMSEWYVNSAKEDREWWLANGPGMVYNYIMAQRDRDTVLATVDGAPALEVETTGDPNRAGFIDRILYRPAQQQIIIDDDKTGSSWPQDSIQLKTYAAWADANRDAFGAPVRSIWYRYWHARKGEYILTREYTQDDERELTFRYDQLDRAYRAGIYPARPSNMCKACPVRSSCPVKAEGNADVYHQLTA
jgi:hypothetical protein